MKNMLDTAIIKLKGVRNSVTKLIKLNEDEASIVGINDEEIKVSNDNILTIFKYFSKVDMIPDDEIEFTCSDKYGSGCIVKCVSSAYNNTPDDINSKERVELTIFISPSTHPELKVIINVDKDYLYKKFNQISYVFAGRKRI